MFKKQNETSPLVILHTSSEEHDVINSFRQEQNSYFLLKPIKSEELYKTLRRAAEQNEREMPVMIPQETTSQLSAKPNLEVLLVDDNPVNMVLNNKMIRSLIPDAHFTEAVNGLEALEQCKSKQFSLVLMDVQMPVMDGIEATKQIRLLPGYADVPVIGVTAGNILGEKEKCLSSGMNDFLPKPLRQSDLSEMLKKYVSEDNAESDSDEEQERYLDTDILSESIGDDDEDFKQIFLNLVIQELTSAESNIKTASKEQDMDEIKRILHKLKGTAGTAGLVKLADTARHYEAKTNGNMDFSEMEQGVVNEISIGLNLIKSLIK